MSDEEIDALKERVKQLESQLRDQRSTALYAALGSAILLGSGVWIGHTLHSDPIPPAQTPVVVSIPPQPAAPPAPTPAPVPAPTQTATPTPTPEAIASAAPVATQATTTRPAPTPTSSAPHRNVDHGF